MGDFLPAAGASNKPASRLLRTVAVRFTGAAASTSLSESSNGDQDFAENRCTLMMPIS